MCYVFVLTHFDVICELLLNRRTTTWNLRIKQMHADATFPRLENKAWVAWVECVEKLMDFLS